MALIGEDPEKPGLKPLRIAAGAQGVERSYESFLYSVLRRVFVPDQRDRITSKLMTISFDQDAEELYLSG